MEQRLEFVRLAEGRSVTVSELCRRFGISRETGHKWLRRYEASGEAGLQDRSSKPKSHPAATPPEVEELVCQVRRSHPAWGGRKIRGFLLRQGHQGVPAASTITRILRRHGLVQPAVAEPRIYQRFETDAPNRLWQMDFKGWFTLSTGQRTHPFGVIDDHSRYNLTLRAADNQRTGTVKGFLTAAFTRYGVPERMLMDNGSPWGNDINQPWTPLTVWLCDLGIIVNHIRPFRPQTQGKEERFHRTLDLEVITTRSRWDSYQQVQDAFDTFRVLYNHHRPHQALGETIVPADRYQPSTRPMPTRIPPTDYPDGSHIRKVGAGGRVSFNTTSWRVGKAFTGRTVAIRPTPADGEYHVYYRHHHIRTIDLSGTYPNTRQPRNRP